MRLRCRSAGSGTLLPSRRPGVLTAGESRWPEGRTGLRNASTLPVPGRGRVWSWKAPRLRMPGHPGRRPTRLTHLADVLAPAAIRRSDRPRLPRRGLPPGPVGVVLAGRLLTCDRVGRPRPRCIGPDVASAVSSRPSATGRGPWPRLAPRGSMQRRLQPRTGTKQGVHRRTSAEKRGCRHRRACGGRTR